MNFVQISTAGLKAIFCFFSRDLVILTQNSTLISVYIVTCRNY